ncbi:hypothetical protein BCR44DRAFT_1422437 [Catenaria anguillulae PL171]|uniref:Uncharacterized protein n=1 Tax=Catenaria anguillulae PL171 TaxID=765915 RepID=A0A1Y2I302_9FUNG|nr:hypothetical protein BCR44DRAFT_1433667 [Catenaria anguillulae PL171]ORZ39963.1 hypothetical protein BCR44DRAFT_1425991 [Catenaria anguillulae PL171]ORZ41246.1 hypothetical protein BCR44DRAFT_1422437 [Catenaria anguillulae PL171]
MNVWGITESSITNFLCAVCCWKDGTNSNWRRTVATAAVSRRRSWSALHMVPVWSLRRVPYAVASFLASICLSTLFVRGQRRGCDELG